MDMGNLVSTAAAGSVVEYMGLQGGLYFGNNVAPAAHADFGTTMARRIQPIDATGEPNPNGAIGLMSISMSNASLEWCHAASSGAMGEPPCLPHTFMGQAADDPSINDKLVIINGARVGQALDRWDAADDDEYARIATDVLPAFGLTEAQVQVVWVKSVLAEEPSRPSLPHPNASAYKLERTIGDVVRALRARYPNLRQIFFTSRIYGGYSEPDQHSPEPWAYETGFGTKWAIEAQITQRAIGEVDANTGDLTGTPFMAWGPYLWSYGDRARNDGLIWTREDFSPLDGMHVTESGGRKVADRLLAFFKTSPFTECWFLEGQSCH